MLVFRAVLGCAILISGLARSLASPSFNSLHTAVPTLQKVQQALEQNIGQELIDNGTALGARVDMTHGVTLTAVANITTVTETQTEITPGSPEDAPVVHFARDLIFLKHHLNLESERLAQRLELIDSKCTQAGQDIKAYVHLLNLSIWYTDHKKTDEGAPNGTDVDVPKPSPNSTSTPTPTPKAPKKQSTATATAVAVITLAGWKGCGSIPGLNLSVVGGSTLDCHPMFNPLEKGNAGSSTPADTLSLIELAAMTARPPFFFIGQAHEEGNEECCAAQRDGCFVHRPGNPAGTRPGCPHVEQRG